MSLRSHPSRFLIGLTVFMIAGCVSLHPPVAVLGTSQAVKSAGARVILQPQLLPSRGIQTVVTGFAASDVARLAVVPYLRNGSGVFQPLSSTTGSPTTSPDSTTWLAISQSSPSIQWSAPIVLNNLSGNSTYRFYARAYNTQGALISSDDASSSVDLAVGSDEHPTVGTCPIKLLDRGFAGRTTVTLAATGRPGNLSTLTTDIYSLSEGGEVLEANGSATTSAGIHPDTLTLNNLRPNTTYRVKAAALDASNAVMATNSVDVVVTNNDAPDPVTLSVTIPYTASTFAGSAEASGSSNGTVAIATFNHPCGVAMDASGSLYVADTDNHVIRKITSTGDVTTLAGSAGTAGSINGTGSLANFRSPRGVAVDTSGNVYVADTGNHVIRKITAGGVVSTLAGSVGHSGTLNSTGTSAKFSSPCGVAVDTSGNVFVADTNNNLIRKIVISTTVVTTLAGSGTASGSVDATGTAARFNGPAGIAVDKLGNLYVADTNNHLIRKIITSSAVVSTLMGTAGVAGSVDATGTAAKFNQPCGLAVDTSGNVFVADTGNHLIRMSNAAGAVTTLVGTAGVSGFADAGGVAARFNTPIGLALDTAGNVYVGDSANHLIREVR